MHACGCLSLSLCVCVFVCAFVCACVPISSCPPSAKEDARQKKKKKFGIQDLYHEMIVLFREQEVPQTAAKRKSKEQSQAPSQQKKSQG